MKPFALALLLAVPLFAQSDKPHHTRPPGPIYKFLPHVAGSVVCTQDTAWEWICTREDGSKVMVSKAFMKAIKPEVVTSEPAQSDKPDRSHRQPCADTSLGCWSPELGRFTGQNPMPPQPEWVPDPYAAGHWDCLDTLDGKGQPVKWTAYAPVEPEKYYSGPIATPGQTMVITPRTYPPITGLYTMPTLDKKGHVLASRPSPPICIQDKP
jgi:hypothetical protein